MTKKILINFYHWNRNVFMGGNFRVLNWWVKEYIWSLFQMNKRRNLAYVSASLTHTWLIDFLLKKACAMGLITVSVSSQWKASTCLPCISLCKSCVVLCCAQWVYVFKRYHNTIGPSPTSTFPFSEVVIIHIDLTMPLDKSRH